MHPRKAELPYPVPESTGPEPEPDPSRQREPAPTQDRSPTPPQPPSPATPQASGRGATPEEAPRQPRPPSPPQGQERPQAPAPAGIRGQLPTEAPILTRHVGAVEAFHRFWPLTKGDRRWMLLVGLCAIVAALAETVTILLFAQLTDQALAQGSVSAFWNPAGTWLTVALLGAVVGYLGNSLAAWTAERFLLRLRARVFTHLQTLPPHFFQRNRRGDLVERLTGDVDAIEHLVVSGLVSACTAVFSTLFYGAAALWLRWELALATFVAAPIFFAATRRFTSRLREVSRRLRAADGALTSVVEETLVNVVLTQAYNRQRDEETRLSREALRWLRASVASARLNALYEQLIEVLETLCVLTIIGLGAWEISAGRMSLGQLLAFAAFIGYLYPPIRSLGQLGLTATAATAAADRLLEILDARPAVIDPPPERTTPFPHRARGELAVQDVTFRYPNAAPGQHALAALSFTAQPGAFLVVTGPSGAGKSTLAALLLRFYDPDAGTIRLDGIEVDRLSLADLRRNITLLPQETLVLHDTIEHNIACGRDHPTPTHEEVVQAARAADAHAFVTALPNGYDTVIAPATAALSGGQLQRIAIARAMLRDAPVLILDEPTTGLDTLAAQRILGPLHRLAAGRTTLVISHDLDLATGADLILVLDEGHLTESGTHPDLLARGGLYTELFESGRG
ncbi:ATP-binding cassette, subfamily B [Streptomyces yunnanensis]|uniref:ATP-binding cassette, subfamily B n=2 Tax=Streptomyces yunnanensis TaxID=156453 RepID=A0A9X8QRR1_9ACTN|nr:ATP-binding cassette, subfamily B [Streptomyces yunnanensis]